MTNEEKAAVANEAEKATNKIFLELLDKTLDAPYFKNIPKQSLILALGVPLKGTLYNYMNRSEYGEEMARLFKEENVQGIREFHTKFITKHAPEAIQVVLKVYHPQYRPL